MKNLSVILFIILFTNTARAQIGCTDPLATNFNSGATINDGSCIYSNAMISPLSSYVLDTLVTETSGLIAWNNELWTHVDNDDTTLYALDTLDGSIIQSYPLPNVVNHDWEEISQDSNFVYVGDFGNNAHGNRTDLKILRVDKNSLLANVPLIDTINFSYEDQVDFTALTGNTTDFDCESFIVTRDSIFLFTKQWTSNMTSVYSLPKIPGTYSAKKKTTYNVQGYITGATFLEDKKLIVLCGYNNLLQPFFYLLYDYNDSNYFSGNKRKITISLPIHQVEGVATVDGLKYYISNEAFVRPPTINISQTMHILDLSLYLGNYINGLGTNVTSISNEDVPRVFPNPVKDKLNIKHSNTELNFILTNEVGQTILSGKLLNGDGSIDISNLSKGVYFLQWENSSLKTKVIKM